MKTLRMLLSVLALCLLLPIATAPAHEGHENSFVDTEACGEPESSAESEEHSRPMLVFSAGADASRLQVGKAKKGLLNNTLTLPGRVKAAEDRAFDINLPVKGVVKEVLVQLGDVIEKGKPLAVIASPEVGDKLDSILEERNRILAARELKENELNMLIIKQQVIVAQAERDYKRQDQLFKVSATSAQNRELAKRDLDVAQTALNELKGQLKIELSVADKHLERTTTAGRSALLVMGMSDSDFDQALAKGEVRTDIVFRSPVSGIVTARDLTPGESFDTRKKVLSILDLSKVWIMLDVYQEQLGKVAVDQPVLIKTASQEELSGSIAAIGSQVDAASGTTFARIVVDNTRLLLKPGVSVTGEITTSRSAQEALLLDANAIVEADGKSIVFVKYKDMAYLPVTVTTGARNGSLVQITGGIGEEDEVAVSGAKQLYAESLLKKQTASAGHAPCARPGESTLSGKLFALVPGFVLGVTVTLIIVFVSAFVKRKRSKVNDVDTK